ncbi:MAG: TIR domain-containing protein [Solirubrobacteraceae bacterium]
MTSARDVDRAGVQPPTHAAIAEPGARTPAPPPTSFGPADFFVSYTASDRAWAEWIAWELEDAGYRVVIQAWDFRPGSDFVAAMRKAAAECRRTLAVLSAEYLRSEFALSEWAAAYAADPLGREGRLVPVRVESFVAEGLDLSRAWIDLVDLDEEQARRQLLAGVSLARVKPERRPAFPRTRSVTSAPRFPGSLARRSRSGLDRNGIQEKDADRDVLLESDRDPRSLLRLPRMAERQPISEAHVAYGARLRAAREKAKLSREGLAARLDFSAKTVERYEKGTSLPAAPVIAAWEKECRVAPGELLDEEYRALPPRPRTRSGSSLDEHEIVQDEAVDREAERDSDRARAHGACAGDAASDVVAEVAGDGGRGAQTGAQLRLLETPVGARRWLVALAIFGVIFALGVTTVELVGHADKRATSRPRSQGEQFADGMRSIAARLDRARVDTRRQLAVSASGQQRTAAERLSKAYAHAAAASRRLRPPIEAASLHAQLNGALLRARDAYASLHRVLRLKDRSAFRSARDDVRQAEGALEGVLVALGSVDLAQ